MRFRFGANFGCPAIPEALSKRVSERRYKGIPVADGTVAILVGCCNSLEDKRTMNIVATNGSRGLYWETVEVKRHPQPEFVGFWHFVWAYCPR